MDNKEIELKFVIDKARREKILADIEIIAEFVGEKRQIDTYYIPEFKSFDENGETKECLRIRQSNGKNVMCYKNIHRESNPVYCDEFETELSDNYGMEKILFALGFKVQMVIDKVRKSFVYGEFEIDFDSVNDKLEILEIELKNNSLGEDAILEFVKKYGLTKSDVTYRGIQKIILDLNERN